MKLFYTLFFLLPFKLIAQEVVEVVGHVEGYSLDIPAYNKAGHGDLSEEHFILEYDNFLSSGIFRSFFSYEKESEEIFLIDTKETPSSGAVSYYATTFKNKHYFIADGLRVTEYNPISKESLAVNVPISGQLYGYKGRIGDKIYFYGNGNLFSYDGITSTAINTNNNGLELFGHINSPGELDEFYFIFLDSNNNQVIQKYDGLNFTNVVEIPDGQFVSQIPGSTEKRSYFNLIINNVEILHCVEENVLKNVDIPFTHFNLHTLFSFDEVDVLIDSGDNSSGLLFFENSQWSNRGADYHFEKFVGKQNGKYYFEVLNSGLDTVVLVYDSALNTFEEVTEVKLTGHQLSSFEGVIGDLLITSQTSNNTSEKILVVYNGQDLIKIENPENKEFLNFRGNLGGHLLFAFRDLSNNEGSLHVLKDVASAVSLIKDGNIPFTIFPNPVKSQLFITLDRDEIITNLKSHIYDAQGVLYKSFHNIDFLNMGSSIKVDVDEIPAGIYFIKLYTDDFQFKTVKFSKS